jgi:hypothetical protein
MHWDSTSGTKSVPLCMSALRAKIRPAALLQVGGPMTLAFLRCNSCIWEIDQAQLAKPPWSGSRQRYRCPGCGGAWSGTSMAPPGGHAERHRQLLLVQLAVYPKYNGKRDHHRYRHGDAGAHVPEQNEFPDCHGQRSAQPGEGCGKTKRKGTALPVSERVSKPSTASRWIGLDRGVPQDTAAILDGNGDCSRMHLPGGEPI